MVVTMLEAEVDEGRRAVLEEAYGELASSGGVSGPVLESFLLHEVESRVWMIVTLWQDRAALDDYRASVETPAGVLVFRAAGAEPRLKIFDVARRLTPGA